MALLESGRAGSDQFTEGIDEADALDRVNEQFEPAFGGDEPTTQLIQRDGNVLDRRGLLAMLETAERLEDRDDLRVTEVSAPAMDVAAELDENVETAGDARDAVERASEGEIDDAVDAAAEDPGLRHAALGRLQPGVADRLRRARRRHPLVRSPRRPTPSRSSWRRATSPSVRPAMSPSSGAASSTTSSRR